jgi:hypothetical protein
LDLPLIVDRGRPLTAQLTAQLRAAMNEGRVTAGERLPSSRTLAATLTQGLPSVITPSVTDQIWHARRTEALGVGVRVRHGRFDRAIAKVITDRAMTERAVNLSERIRSENGAARISERVDEILAA